MKTLKEKELNKAFDRLDGCISFDGNGADLARQIRKNSKTSYPYKPNKCFENVGVK